MAEKQQQLSRRERQIMDVIYKLGEANAAEVAENLPEPPGYSTVRKLLSILEEKGFLRHIEKDRRYVYLPTQSKQQRSRTALKHLMETFFENSAESMVSALMDLSGERMTEEQLKKLTALIEQKRKERK